MLPTGACIAMNPRTRLNVASLLLTSTALLAIAALPSASLAASLNEPFIVAQAAAPDSADKPKPPQPPQAKPPAPAARPQPPAAQPRAQTPPPGAPARPAAQSSQPQHAPAAQPK